MKITRSSKMIRLLLFLSVSVFLFACKDTPVQVVGCSTDKPSERLIYELKISGDSILMDSYSYTYDSENRLTQSVHVQLGDSNITTENYTYDSDGLISRIHSNNQRFNHIIEASYYENAVPKTISWQRTENGETIYTNYDFVQEADGFDLRYTRTVIFDSSSAPLESTWYIDFNKESEQRSVLYRVGEQERIFSQSTFGMNGNPLCFPFENGIEVVLPDLAGQRLPTLYREFTDDGLGNPIESRKFTYNYTFDNANRVVSILEIEDELINRIHIYTY